MTAQNTIVSLSKNNKPSRTCWRRHYDRWRESGGSRAAYCRKAGLNTARFYYYCRVFSGDDPTGASSVGQRDSVSPAFLPLTLTPEAGPIVRVQLADVTISCEGEVSGKQLSTWLQAIRNTL